MAGPIEQFEIKDLVDISIGGVDLSFTNASAYMVLTVVISGSFLLLATRKRKLLPDRWQSSAELLYELIAKTLRDNAGEHGMRFFPFVFSLFMFILVANTIGMFPYAFTVTLYGLFKNRRLRHRHDAEGVGLEHLAHMRYRRRLECPDHADTGIVHQDVDRPRRFDCGRDAFRAGNVKRQDADALRLGKHSLARVAHGGNDAPALRV
jgi:ATP synthase A chain